MLLKTCTSYKFVLIVCGQKEQNLDNGENVCFPSIPE